MPSVQPSILQRFNAKDEARVSMDHVPFGCYPPWMLSPLQKSSGRKTVEKPLQAWGVKYHESTLAGGLGTWWLYVQILLKHLYMSCTAMKSYPRLPTTMLLVSLPNRNCFTKDLTLRKPDESLHKPHWTLLRPHSNLPPPSLFLPQGRRRARSCAPVGRPAARRVPTSDPAVSVRHR